MFDEVTKINLLYDFYGQLLSLRQAQVMDLYYGENLSLSEIAGELGISRQGVHDALKNAEKSLTGYEQKLGLVKRFEETKKAVDDIDRLIDEIVGAGTADAATREKLLRVKAIIDGLEE